MYACDKAVRLEPENGPFRTSRGVAKALVRKVGREWLTGQRLRHTEWLAALRAGQNPFTPDQLKRLREDKPPE